MSDPTPKLSTPQKQLLAVLACLQFLVVLDLMIIAPIGDILISALNMNTRQFGLIVSAYAFSAAVSGIISAGFVDRFDRKQTLLVLFTGFLLGTMFCALAATANLLLLARIVTGAFGGLMAASLQPLSLTPSPPDQRGRAMGLIQMAFAASQILGIPLVLKRMYADKDRQESIIKERIARWIIVRPGFLNNGRRTGKPLALTNLGGVKGGQISRTDVADFLLAQVKEPKFIGQTPLLVSVLHGCKNPLIRNQTLCRRTAHD